MCPYVVVMVGLVCRNDPWGYAVEPLILDRCNVRRQTKPHPAEHQFCFFFPRRFISRKKKNEFDFEAGHGRLRLARTVEVRFRDASAHQTWLCKRTSNGVTPEEDSTS